jgi:hypothetical protein
MDHPPIDEHSGGVSGRRVRPSRATAPQALGLRAEGC